MEGWCVTQENVNIMCMECFKRPIVVGYAVAEGT